MRNNLRRSFLFPFFHSFRVKSFLSIFFFVYTINSCAQQWLLHSGVVGKLAVSLCEALVFQPKVRMCVCVNEIFSSAACVISFWDQRFIFFIIENCHGVCMYHFKPTTTTSPRKAVDDTLSSTRKEHQEFVGKTLILCSLRVFYYNFANFQA